MTALLSGLYTNMHSLYIYISSRRDQMKYSVFYLYMKCIVLHVNVVKNQYFSKSTKPQKFIMQNTTKHST